MCCLLCRRFLGAQLACVRRLVHYLAVLRFLVLSVDQVRVRAHLDVRRLDARNTWHEVEVE